MIPAVRDAQTVPDALAAAMAHLASRPSLAKRVREGRIHEVDVLMGIVRLAQQAGCDIQAMELRASDEPEGRGRNDATTARPPLRVQACLETGSRLFALDEIDGRLQVRTWTSRAEVEQTLSDYPYHAWSPMDPHQWGDGLEDIGSYIPLEIFKAKLGALALQACLPPATASATPPRL